MSDQLLQAAINALTDIRHAISILEQHELQPTAEFALGELDQAALELDAAITIAQRQADTQAADAYETQFAPIESFDSAEGSPICPECGAVMLAEYDGNEQVIGYDCAACLAEYSYLWDTDGDYDYE